MKNKFKHFFRYLLNLLILNLTQNKEENFEFFKNKLEEKYPKGAMFVYNGIDFYIKDFCSDEDGEEIELYYDEDKIYVICEYYDPDKKEFNDKVIHQDFVINRIKQYQKIIENS